MTQQLSGADRIIRPQAAQERLLASPADLAIYGGAAGAGKSFALLLQPILHIKNPGFGAVIFRKTNPMIVGEGGLWDKSQELYPLVGGKPYYGNPKQWVFKSGAKVTLSHMQHEKDKHNWDGQQIPLIEWDELDQFSESQFWYMLSRNRSTCGVRPYMRGSCNPNSESWVAKLLEWWIDQDSGYPIMKRSGHLRWFIRLDGALEWGDSWQAMHDRFPDIVMPPNTPPGDKRMRPLSLTFVPARLDDNPILESKDPEYRAKLLAMPLVERERLLNGNWKIRAEAGLKFPRDKWVLRDEAPPGLRLCRYWDKACLTAGTMIATSRGEIPIENVVKGDMVITRRGWRRVNRAGCTATTSEVATVIFSNGRTLTGTPGHLIWCGYWTPIDTLSGRDSNLAICSGNASWPKKGESRCGTQRSLSSTASHIAGVLGSGISKALSEAWEIPCTEQYGDFTTAIYPLAMMSTTLTTTGITTRLKILSASRTRNTCGGTALNGKRMPSGTKQGPHSDRLWHGSTECEARGGIESCIATGASPRGLKRQLEQRCVSNVDRSLNTVELAASQFDFVQGLVKRERERFAARRNVLVYDLEIDGESEFFANGILVHNSTQGGTGARTAGALVGELPNHIALGLPRFWIVHVDAGRWGDAERESRIRAIAESDARYGHVTTGMEQEPGSGGKHSSMMTVNNLAGFDVFSERATTNKAARWTPLSAQQQIGNVAIVRGSWDWAGMMDELDQLAGDEQKDKSKLRDIADALSGAFKFLVGGGGVIDGPLLASGDPDFLEEERKPFSEQEINDMPEDWRELVEEASETAKERGAQSGRRSGWGRRWED
jgi:phage terminase large subunit-like protein